MIYIHPKHITALTALQLHQTTVHSSPTTPLLPFPHCAKAPALSRLPQNTGFYPCTTHTPIPPPPFTKLSVLLTGTSFLLWNPQHSLETKIGHEFHVILKFGILGKSGEGISQILCSMNMVVSPLSLPCPPDDLQIFWWDLSISLFVFQNFPCLRRPKFKTSRLTISISVFQWGKKRGPKLDEMYSTLFGINWSQSHPTIRLYPFHIHPSGKKIGRE